LHIKNLKNKIMGNFESMRDAGKDLVKKIAEQREAEALKKEKEALQTKLDKLDLSISKLEEKIVEKPLTNTSTPTTTPPAKSKTLTYVGIGILVLVAGYLAYKFKK